MNTRTKELRMEFLKKYPKPNKCPITIADWCSPLGYCWGVAQSIDEGKRWDETRCPCEMFLPKDRAIIQQQLQPGTFGAG